MITNKLAGKIILLIAFAIIISCGSIVIPDPLDPRLLRYTDKGNNAAGALVNEDPWISEIKLFSSSAREVQSFMSGDSLMISFEGTAEDKGRITFSFILRGFDIDSLSDLSKLNNEKIFFADSDNSVFYLASSNGGLLEGTAGQIYFKSVKLVPELENSDVIDYMIISGTFSFNIPDQDISVTYGRFDFKIYKFEENFLFNQKIPSSYTSETP